MPAFMNSGMSNEAVSAHDGRRKLTLHVLAAVALPAIAMGFFAARDGLAAARGQASLTQVAVALPAVDDPITGHFSRFALNVLLVPLLDDDVPSRWTDVGINYFCGPATRVDVDGKPLVPGASIPATAFTVRWRIDQCWPLPYDALELSGVVELQVFHDDDGLSAIVDAHQLRISTPKGSRSVSTPFVASMLLGAAPDAPSPRLAP